jgi:hypothetical protein
VWTADILAFLLDNGVSAFLTTSMFGVCTDYEDMSFYTDDGTFDDDTSRVNGLFDRYRSNIHLGVANLLLITQALHSSCGLSQRSPTPAQEHLAIGASSTRLLATLPCSSVHLAVLLVDAAHLCCHSHSADTCHGSQASCTGAGDAAMDEGASSDTTLSDDDGYQGHFILLSSVRACGACTGCLHNGDVSDSFGCVNPFITYHDPSAGCGGCETTYNELFFAWDSFGTDHDLILIPHV